MAFKEIFSTALYKFSFYPKLLMVNKFKTALYILFLTLIMIIGIITSIAPDFIKAGGFYGIADRYIPDFNVKNGVLTCENVLIDRSDAGVYIEVNTEKQGECTIPEGYISAFVANKTNYAMYNSGQTATKGSLKELGEISKADILTLCKDKTVITITMAFMFAWLVVVLLISMLVNVLIYAALANLVNIMLIRASLRFGDIFKLTVFAMTLPTLFMVICCMLRFGFMPFISQIIVMFYLYKAIIACRNNDGIILEVL